MERITVEAAVKLVLDAVTPVAETRRVPLLEALDAVAAEDVAAKGDTPPFDRSAFDGFAFRSADTAAARADKPARFRIAATVYAGTFFVRPLLCGESVRIMTGAAMPEDADCMIPKEEVREDGDSVLLFRPAAPHQNYISRGEDIRRGQRLVAAGERLDFARLAVLSSAGFGSVSVLRPPRIGVLCTGDELSPPDAPLRMGKIYDSNETLLACRLAELGFRARVLPALKDDAAAVADALEAALSGEDALDLVLTSGAVSVGDRDIMHEALERLGAERLFWRLACKPGGALLAGLWRGKPLLCLSGNPFACFANFELVAKPALAKLASRPDLFPRRRRGVLAGAFAKSGGQRRFVRARLAECAEGGRLPLVTLPDAHASGQLFSALDCNCLVDIPAGSEALVAGSEVEAVLL